MKLGGKSGPWALLLFGEFLMVTPRKKRHMIQFVDTHSIKPKFIGRKDATVGVGKLEFEQLGDILRVISRRQRTLPSGRIVYEAITMDLPIEDWIKLDAWVHFNLERALAASKLEAA